METLEALPGAVFGAGSWHHRVIEMSEEQDHEKDENDEVANLLYSAAHECRSCKQLLPSIKGRRDHRRLMFERLSQTEQTVFPESSNIYFKPTLAKHLP